MLTIDEWARRWNVRPDAIEELKACMGVAALGTMGVPPNSDQPGSEGRQQSLVQLEAAQSGIRLFRNNSGAFTSDDGRLVRFGLGNVSKQVNEILKSPDLVGWRRRLITPDLVGTVIGQATMREMKHEGWTFNPNDRHEAAQFNFIKLAVADGCDAMFATGPGTL